jgi:purine-binding chemotaxis protein CheW
MPDLRNVVVFTLGGARYAIELRWIREVVTLGFVTNVPTAPSALGGVVNLHGAILPVIDLTAVLGHASGPTPRQGDGALVLEAEGVTCALRVDQVDHVASLSASTPEVVLDSSGRPITLLDPSRLLRSAIERMSEASPA